MFGTRACLIVDVCYVLTLAAPLVTLWSVRLVRQKRYALHRQIQTYLLTACWSGVLALEGYIRLAGGSWALTEGSAYAGTAVMKIVASVHILGAVLTYLLWSWLLVVSRKRFGTTLPGTFSTRHKQLGWTVFAGLTFTALSATAVYVMAFVK